MGNMKSGLVLAPDEQLVMELEAEMWADSSNPISKIIGSIIRLINLILGYRRKGYLVITNKRVVEFTQFKALWILNVGENVKYLLPSSVKEVGYIKEGTFCGCLCQAYHLYYDSFTQRTSVLLSDVDSNKEAQKVVDAFYNAIFVSQ